MSYNIKIKQFEGPLDLLLHLISKSKISIEDISISEITQQYLDYLDNMKKFDIEIASGFLVMAATLIHIKSCLLIPRAKPDTIDDEGKNQEKDLIAKLVEYKKYKNAAIKLQKRELYYLKMYYKLPEEFYVEKEFKELPPDITSETLLETLKGLIEKSNKQVDIVPVIHKIKKESVTVQDRIAELRLALSKCGETTFYTLSCNYKGKEDIIVSFLALLEICKDNLVYLYQAYPFDDITIKRRIDNG